MATVDASRVFALLGAKGLGVAGDYKTARCRRSIRACSTASSPGASTTAATPTRPT